MSIYNDASELHGAVRGYLEYQVVGRTSTEKIGAEKLCETIEDYPDLVELLVNGQWREIDRITNHRIDNGVWTSNDVIYIECGHQEYTYQFMDELTIRYPEVWEHVT